MKKVDLQIFGVIISILFLISGCSLKPQQTQRIIDQVLIKKSPCQKVISVKNDGSMPKESLIQKYEVICENNGRNFEATLQLKTDKKGNIIDTKILKGDKAMGWEIQIKPMEKQCGAGEELRCATICNWPEQGEPECHHVCWCIKFHY